ncbi:50S ribosomal protein L4 [Phaeodactylibacter sp.]|jgi:large subunit ribosomal protein L4|uniref:50S ribosomal protein L4 n=1 Tax=Phaeodactylibacter sp. TaxID=1940289 RepID=UPI0025E9AD2F|nr:50S ribosomal protein L4 [Phaeodactylibacter sp.]MCI4650563.1 50S ribosomal protein L4 [Phaeodactylibacter sp.]MCI5089330.1 50S ribosomal protein L4 [Phaeodactylibacter sp.]
MKLEVLNIQGQQTGREIELPEDVFGVEPNEHVVYLAVKQYLAAQRQGTHKAKERNEIAGSTKKLKRQKGTGTARFGDIKNPIFRGGGRIFGPRPRKYNITLNKKVKQLARKSALSSKASAGKIFVIEDFSFEAPKTKAFADILAALKVADQKPVVVTSDYEKEVYLSSRNLPKTKVVRASDLNTYEVMNAGALILSEGAVEKITEAFAN